MKDGFYTTTSDNWLSGWTEKSSKALLKPNLHEKKKKSWSLFDDLLPICSTTLFWIPAKSLHLRSMLSKSMRCTENCNTCRRYWSTKKAQFFSTTLPDCMVHNKCFRNWRNWATEFCLICHIHLSSCSTTTTFSSTSTTFCRENASTSSRRQKMSSKISSNPKEINFSLEKNKNVLIVMVPILINKDAFEPSYNDLKFVVWNHNYICTNLIALLLAHVLCVSWIFMIFLQLFWLR